MQKLKSSFINMLLSLVAITFISGVSLAFMNELTKGPKAEARKQKKIKAIKSVLPEITNNPFEEKMTFGLEGTKDSLDFFIGKNGEEFAGVAVSTFSDKGYNGLIQLMVGFDKNGAIHNIVTLLQKETPGLGTNITSPSFLKQYLGKNPKEWKLKVKKDGGDTDAITGATITSRAFNDAVQRAYDNYVKNENDLKETSE